MSDLFPRIQSLRSAPCANRHHFYQTAINHLDWQGIWRWWLIPSDCNQAPICICVIWLGRSIFIDPFGLFDAPIDFRAVLIGKFQLWQSLNTLPQKLMAWYPIGI